LFSCFSLVKKTPSEYRIVTLQRKKFAFMVFLLLKTAQFHENHFSKPMQGAVTP